MPYIIQEHRAQLNGHINELVLQIARMEDSKPGHCAGLVNYTITKLIRGILAYDAPSYARYNEMVGALECAKLELYRRILAEYEDCKIKENGDV